MIAKLAVHGSDRAEAVAKLGAALRQTEIAGIVTNVPFLAKLAEHSDFAAGKVDTGFIDRHRATLFPCRPPPGEEEALLAALGLLVEDESSSLQPPHPEVRAQRASKDPELRFSSATAPGPSRLGPAGLAPQDEGRRTPWQTRDAFRLNAPPHTSIALRTDTGTVAIDLTHAGPSFRLPDGAQVTARRSGHRLVAEIAGRPMTATWLAGHGTITLLREGVPYVFHLAGESTATAATGSADHVLRAPMPGKIAAVLAKAGETVAHGQPLCVLEAMKMEHILKSPRAATIESIACQPGQQVKEGTELFRFAEEANR
jgi:3-methylcrotonyl-CoA carboxylase alpha subunit